MNDPQLSNALAAISYMHRLGLVALQHLEAGGIYGGVIYKVIACDVNVQLEAAVALLRDELAFGNAEVARRLRAGILEAAGIEASE